MSHLTNQEASALIGQRERAGTGCAACDKEQERAGNKTAMCKACEIEFLKHEVETAKARLAEARNEHSRTK